VNLPGDSNRSITGDDLIDAAHRAQAPTVHAPM
jgi:hypothetical protein